MGALLGESDGVFDGAGVREKYNGGIEKTVVGTAEGICVTEFGATLKRLEDSLVGSPVGSAE